MPSNGVYFMELFAFNVSILEKLGALTVFWYNMYLVDKSFVLRFVQYQYCTFVLVQLNNYSESSNT